MSKTPIGNVKGFVGELMQHIVYTLGLGYMGGSISAIAHLSETELNKLFPYDISKLPYKTSSTTKQSIREALKEGGVLEFLWPMKSLGFPYSKRLPGNDIGSEYVNWLIDTCAAVFATFREFYTTIAIIGNSWVEGPIGRLIVFFIVPYVLIFLTFFPLGVPSFVFAMGFIMSVISSMHEAADCGFMFTFSPITSWFYGLGRCKEITLGCLISIIIIGIIGFFLPMTFIPWWISISFAIWFYSIVVLLFSPFLYKDGIKRVFHEMVRHKLGLTLVFIYLTLKTAMSFLIPPAVFGLVLGTLYVLYELLFKKK